MPVLGPIKRRDLIRLLRRVGFAGPFTGGDHEYMERGTTKLPIPNPHGGDIGVGLLKRILREAKITAEEWERL